MRFMKSSLLVPACLFALQFTEEPSLVSAGGGQYQVEFAVDETTDVEVAIVNLADSTIACHLAAGRLGSNPPPPLAANTLHQTLAWDGKDDIGALLPSGSYGVRVRAGMSASLDKIADKTLENGLAAGNNYFFAPVQGASGFFGMAEDGAGTLYIVGVSGDSWTPSAPQAIRAYDAATGAYIKTVFPPPAGAARNLLVPYGITLLDDTRFNLKYQDEDMPVFSFGTLKDGTFDAPTFSGMLFPEVRDNTLGLLGYDRFANRTGYCGPCQRVRVFNRYAEIGVNTSEMVSRPGFLTQPELPPFMGGPLYLCYLPGKTHALVGGLYGMDSVPFTGKPQQTGFWRDGRVFKVDLATGAATAFISLNADSLPQSSPTPEGLSPDAAVHGVAVDDSGHVFICDRMHQQIGVYDSAGNFIKAIPLSWPDNIAVNKKTGELYVAVRGIGPVQVRKFSDWRSSAPAVTASQEFWAGNKSFMALHQPPSGAPVIWVTGGTCYNICCGPQRAQTILGIRDDGNAFTLIGNFTDSSNAFGNVSRGWLDRITTDRKRGTVYVTNGWGNVLKVEDWSNPVMVTCSTTTGEALGATECRVDAAGNLYARTSGMTDGKLFRYSADSHLHAPLPFGGRGTNMAVDSLCNEWGPTVLAMGFDVTPDGRIYVLHQGHDYLTAPYARFHPTLELWDTNHVILDSNVLDFKWETLGGVKLDKAGKLYVGALYLPPDHDYPAAYASDNAYRAWVGSVFKFDPQAGGAIWATGCCNVTDSISGALKIYASSGYAPFSNGCTCRSPRFDVDAYGRLFIPNAITNSVAVVDNVDNVITRFGEYGNADSRGPGIPMLYPIGAAATDDHIYVADQLNCRLLRVKMDYALENMHLPELSAHGGRGVLQYAPTAVIAAPNPFNPSVNLTLTGALTKDASLKVFDLSGKLVADLSGKISAGRVVWNAAGNASGVYVAVAQKGTLRLTRKIIYSK